ncbi:MAG: aldehyde dehydrogenase family protein, partial [Erysipelotrichaceae bacterium]
MLQEKLTKQQAYFNQDATKSVAFRKTQLKKLKQAIIDYETRINEALRLDLNKSEFEAYTTELGFCLNSIEYVLKHIDQWARCKKVSTPLFQFYTKSYIVAEPLGTILIIGPYNYPFQLIIEPLIGAIAAGNTVIIKPSEQAIHTGLVIESLIQSIFDPEYVDVVLGDEQVTKELVTLPFNHLFFTGSTKVGQLIYMAASQQLTPVTLELGGKSPTIVEESADLYFAARRIAFGKFINAGQTCIAPDYVYVQASVKVAFINQLKLVIDEMQYKPEEFGHIVSKRHFDRLNKLIDPKKVIFGNQSNEDTLYISPTLIDNATWDDSIMQEEIFGPLLPIMSFDSVSEVIDLLRQKEKPLALYLFTRDKQVENDILT